MNSRKFVLFSWAVLVFNVLVILWGAIVRATGSGAGCGSHWPLCNGEVLPVSMQTATTIEFFHRISSGFALILVIILFVWALRLYPKGHAVRTGAGLSLLFIITEALVGAGLVLFEWVAQDVSIGRVISISVHLVNTFLLLASLTLTAWWASGSIPGGFARSSLVITTLVIAMIGSLAIGISGAITALGDTVFPAGSLIEGFKQDFSPAAHFILRLRIWHPIIAILVGSYLIVLSGVLAMTANDEVRLQAKSENGLQPTNLNSLIYVKRFALLLITWVCAQLIVGIINLILLAPVWMQIIHLLVADLVWITLVLLAAASLGIKQNEDINVGVRNALDLKIANH